MTWLSKDPTYRSYRAMLNRCYREKDKCYDRYGGRGIVVCARWRAAYSNFLEDMGPGPLGRTLDRYPNNDGDYEPTNCRWATLKQQARTSKGNPNINKYLEDPEVRSRQRRGISRALRRCWQDPAYRANQVEKQFKRRHSDATRARIREAAIRRWSK